VDAVDQRLLHTIRPGAPPSCRRRCTCDVLRLYAPICSLLGCSARGLVCARVRRKMDPSSLPNASHPLSPIGLPLPPRNQPPVPLTEDGKCPSDRPECYNHGLDANGRLKPGAVYYSKRETTPDGLRYIVVRVSDGEEFSVPYSSKVKVCTAIVNEVTRKNRLGKPRTKVEAAQQRGSNAKALAKQLLTELDAQEDDLASAAREMGGNGKTPVQQVLPTGNAPVAQPAAPKKCMKRKSANKQTSIRTSSSLLTQTKPRKRLKVPTSLRKVKKTDFRLPALLSANGAAGSANKQTCIRTRFPAKMSSKRMKRDKPVEFAMSM